MCLKLTGKLIEKIIIKLYLVYVISSIHETGQHKEISVRLWHRVQAPQNLIKKTDDMQHN